MLYKFGLQVIDLHRHKIDHLTIPSSQGKGLLRRVEEVFDCWFESGSMPYGQLHYPFENKGFFEGGGFPADFVAEGKFSKDSVLPSCHLMLHLQNSMMSQKRISAISRYLTSVVNLDQNRSFRGELAP